MKKKQTAKDRTPSSASPSDAEDEMSQDLSKYVPTRKAAEMLGVDRTQAALLVKQGKLKEIKPGHDWLIYIPSIDRYLETKSKRGRPASRPQQAQKAKVSGQG